MNHEPQRVINEETLKLSLCKTKYIIIINHHTHLKTSKP